MSILPLIIVLPLGTAFLLVFLKKIWRGMPDVAVVATTLGTAGLSCILISAFNTPVKYHVGGWEPVNGVAVGITLQADSLSALLLVIVNILALMISVYSIEYMKQYTDKTKYYILLLLMIAGLNGVILAGDLFNMFVFLEISAIASYSLVAFGIGSEELEASFKYQVLGGTASAFILFAIAIVYRITGTLNMADAAAVLAGQRGNAAAVFSALLFFTGFSLKAALMPFHAWLPDAHPSAPAPISAMLSGVVIKVLGVYALIRVMFTVFGTAVFEHLLLLLLITGTLSMTAGAILAFGQTDVKRMLAYSSISQIGFVVFALGLGTRLGILAGLLHLVNHAVFKSLLFLDSGALVYRTGSRDMTKMGGIAKHMPITAGTSLAGSLSISGIPPLSGFWSKLLIIAAAVQSRHFVLALCAALVSIVTIAYFMKFIHSVFTGTGPRSNKKLREVPLSMSMPLIILAVLSICMGLLLIPGIRETLLMPAVDIIVRGIETVHTAAGG